MLELKFLGSGGHGIVVAGKLFADAAAKKGYRAQAFASYGGLRRGGRVEAYVRIDDQPILLHSKVYEADYLVLMDERFAHDPRVLSSLRKGGRILVNTPKPAHSFPSLSGIETRTVDGNGIAARNDLVTSSGMPVINTTMLGAAVGWMGTLEIEFLIEAIREGGIPAPEGNARAAEQAFRWVCGAGSPAKDQGPGSSETGGGASADYPDFLPERCNRCGICSLFCPDVAVRLDNDLDHPVLDRDLCKGCGICAVECTRKAILFKGVENDPGHHRK